MNSSYSKTRNKNNILCIVEHIHKYHNTQNQSKIIYKKVQSLSCDTIHSSYKISNIFHIILWIYLFQNNLNTKDFTEFPLQLLPSIHPQENKKNVGTHNGIFISFNNFE